MNIAFAEMNTNKQKLQGPLLKTMVMKRLNLLLSKLSLVCKHCNYQQPKQKNTTLRGLYQVYIQKCLDFEKGGELAVNLFKVYEYCRKQVLQVTKLESDVKLDDAVLFIKTILEGWDGIKDQSTNSTHFLDNVYD